MSIAWATVVVVVLLLPGFAFLAGLYFPEQVTREVTPISPLGQLAVVVGVAFVLHLLFYFAINGSLCRSMHFGIAFPCVAFEQFVPMLRIDGPPSIPLNPAETRAMLDANVGYILLYFVTISVAAFVPGLVVGILIERGPLQHFARHRWMYALNEGRRHARGARNAKRIKANVLSRTAHAGKVLMYTGAVEDFFANPDGTISHLILSEPKKGLVSVWAAGRPDEVVLTAALPASTRGRRNFLFLTSEDIANVFFEEESTVTAVTAERIERAKEAIRSRGRPSPVA